jgi:hypothetical protein
MQSYTEAKYKPYEHRSPYKGISSRHNAAHLLIRIMYFVKDILYEVHIIEP